ncbi:MAG: DoxX family protein [Candidatus Udaeobacter sp.]
MNSNDASAIKRQWLFVLARVYLGVTFLFSDHGNRQPGELTGFLKFAMKNGYSWYQSFLNAVVLPHPATFGMLVVVAEIYVGIAFVLGLTTRLAALVALFLLFNYMCAKGDIPWGPGIDQSDIILAFIVSLSGAGRIFGVDRILHERFPRVPIW